MKRAVAWCAVAVVLGLASRLCADEWEQSLGVPIPVLVRIQGYIGTKPPNRNELGWL